LIMNIFVVTFGISILRYNTNYFLNNIFNTFMVVNYSRELCIVFVYYTPIRKLCKQKCLTQISFMYILLYENSFN
jgi:hypothetical protein